MDTLTPSQDPLAASTSATPVRDYVLALAKQYNVTYIPTPSDAVADDYARMSDSQVTLDEVEYLLLALERAEILLGDQGARLHGRYLRELGYN